ncbi:MAG TPA: hypothetical protein VKV33_10930 [Streptosporangiaceae bacterium]|nr:hypothetical protein [Streptosporangiaceae bacterium]
MGPTVRAAFRGEILPGSSSVFVASGSSVHSSQLPAAGRGFASRRLIRATTSSVRFRFTMDSHSRAPSSLRVALTSRSGRETVRPSASVTSRPPQSTRERTDTVPLWLRCRYSAQ